MKEYFEKFKALPRAKQLVIVFVIIIILGAIFGEDKTTITDSEGTTYKKMSFFYTLSNRGDFSEYSQRILIKKFRRPVFLLTASPTKLRDCPLTFASKIVNTSSSPPPILLHFIVYNLCKIISVSIFV